MEGKLARAQRDPARGAEIARLVAQQRADQRLDEVGRCSSPSAECTTGLHLEEGLVRRADRTQTSERVEVVKVNKDYHGGRSAVDEIDRVTL